METLCPLSNNSPISGTWLLLVTSNFYELLILYISCKWNDLTFFLLCPIYILNFFVVNPGGSMNPNYILKYGWIIFHGVCISLFVYLLGTLGLFPTFFVVVQLLSRVQLVVIHGLQYTRLPCPSLSPGVCSYSCPLSWWCYLTISSFVALFSCCRQSFQASGSFLMSRLFTSYGQSIVAPASASVLSMTIQDWFPLGLTGLISLQFKGLSGVFSSTTTRRHQFFGTQPSLWSSSHIHTWLLEKP